MARLKLDLMSVGDTDGKAVFPGHPASSGPYSFYLHYAFFIIGLFFFLTCSSFQGKKFWFFRLKVYDLLVLHCIS